MEDHGILLNGSRLFLLQPYQDGGNARLLWPAVERILMVRFEISDFRSLRALYGDRHGSGFSQRVFKLPIR